jgi:N-acetylglucosamine-6-sulfatase
MLAFSSVVLLGATAATATVPPRPSIVFIQTDDQDIELDSLTPMPQLRTLLQSEGATFEHWYVNTPVCCPSRSETLSGKYHHNIRIRAFRLCGCGDEAVGLQHPCGCMDINNTARGQAVGFQTATYADYLQRASYTTGYFGKYLNPPAMEVFCNGGPRACRGHNCSEGPGHGNHAGAGYDPSGPKIAGWDEIRAMCVTAYYNIPWITEKGQIIYTDNQPSNYSTSLVGNWTVDFIHRHAAAARDGKPFFVSAATRAPHSPQTPAPWYMDALPGTKNLVNRPDFNYTSAAAVKQAGDGHAGCECVHAVTVP